MRMSRVPFSVKRFMLAVWTGATLFQAQGCLLQNVDPDVGFRAGVTFVSELAVFLVENAVRGI